MNAELEIAIVSYWVARAGLAVMVLAVLWAVFRLCFEAATVGRCLWSYDHVDGCWDTSCDFTWTFHEGGPSENFVKRCFNCGRSIQVVGGSHAAD